SRGAGKTTFCRALADQARAAGWDVAGLLSPPVFENGVKTGILAENLRTGETRHLAQLAASSHLPLSTFHLPLGVWRFDSSILAWGNQVLETCLPCDLFIVDELGPLELIRGEGWSNALTALRQPTYRVGVVVIRPELVETAQKLLPACKTLSLDPLSAQEFFKLI
ncbi:MAG TPA: nucleoside-triphosphatase, partial [Anaerolineales bacterium]|nr:nucleoside-triphosphatase [Anaerolineales bacterium]